MKDLKALLVSIAAAALLAACGGGGGSNTESGASAAAGSSAPSTPAPAPITLTAATAPIITAADCPRLTSQANSVAALDLSNPNIKAVNDLLLQVDPDHAYPIFVRRPYDFVNWIVLQGSTGATWIAGNTPPPAPGTTATVTIASLGVGVHETLHMDDAAVANCASGYQILYFGSLINTGLQPGDTASIKIVSSVIDPALATDRYYTTYITNAGPGNDFRSVLDEFAAYSGEAHTTLKMLTSGKVPTADAPDVNLAGIVRFMVFLEDYLKAARLNDSATYNKIATSPVIHAAIQTLWSQGEQDLRDASSYVKANQIGVNSAYFSAAYSASLLSELDAIGITHADTTWSGTYLP